MARASKDGGELHVLWYHPRRGAKLRPADEPAPVNELLNETADDWRRVAEIRMVRRGHELLPAPSAKLPRGFLWGEPNKQASAYSTTFVFAPLEKICSVCRAPFVDTARAQKHLYEKKGAPLHVQAVRCLACARRKRETEKARVEHAAALRRLTEAPPSATAYLAAAIAALALLDAGGRARLDRAIGHARRARELGAKGAEKVERQLADRRANDKRGRRAGERL